MNTINFGEHITIDGYGGDKTKLGDKDLVLSCLNGLLEILNMHKLADPVVYFAKGNDKKDPGGWSGFVVIEESHISIHTFPQRRFISADVYTCGNSLDKSLILNYFKNAFDLSDIEDNYIKRGTRYPATNL